MCRDYSNKGLRILRRAPRGASPSYDETEGLQASRDVPEGEDVVDSFSDIGRELKEEFWDNTNRHEVGVGLVGKCFGIFIKKDKQDSMEQLPNYRYVLLVCLGL